MSKPDLTDEQIALGQLYAWIHQRAQYLRAKAANAQDSEAHALATADTNSTSVGRPTDDTTAPSGGQNGGGGR